MQNITKQSCGCSRMKPCKNGLNYVNGIESKHILRNSKDELSSNMQRNISEGSQTGQHPIRRTNKNIIVSPWSAVQVDKQESSLLPSINLSSRPVINRTESNESDVFKTRID